jgi:uncharacterized damage-inducible protein DinB
VAALLRDAVHLARKNKHACRELADRVHRLREELYNKAKAVNQLFVESVARTLQGIEASVRRFSSKSIVEQCLQASKYKTKFEQYHSSIDRLLADLDRAYACIAYAPAAVSQPSTVPKIYEPPAVTKTFSTSSRQTGK